MNRYKIRLTKTGHKTFQCEATNPELARKLSTTPLEFGTRTSPTQKIVEKKQQ